MATQTELEIFCNGRGKEEVILTFPFTSANILPDNRVIDDLASGLRFSSNYLPRYGKDNFFNHDDAGSRDILTVKEFSRLEAGKWLNDGIVNLCFNW